LDKSIHKSKHSQIVALDFHPAHTEYAVLPPDGSNKAFALISFQRGPFEPNGCTVEDVLRVCIDKQQEYYDRYRAIQSLIDSLENMKRESPEVIKREEKGRR
jgi:hypothetical protein